MGYHGFMSRLMAYGTLVKIAINKLLSLHYYRLQNEIGSGQFGTVYTGVWHSPNGGEVRVAVKTLKEESDEVERIKFLQEAAIMGQFKHPNVIEMHGVITVGKPVSSV